MQASALHRAIQLDVSLIVRQCWGIDTRVLRMVRSGQSGGLGGRWVGSEAIRSRNVSAGYDLFS
jgi:hypothetical protein